MTKNNLREWSARLEAGERDDELLAIAARLERAARNEPETIPLDYRRQLRRDLHARYPASQAAGRQWRHLQTLAAVGGLAFFVVLAWLTMSSVQHPSSGGAPAVTESAASDYVYLSHSLNEGVLPLNMVETASGETETQAFLIPGADLTFVVNWSLPTGSPQLAAFANLLDDTGATVAQSDAPLSVDNASTSQRYTSSLQLPIPEALPPGRYQLVVGLYDPANGNRMPITGPEGETTQLALGAYEIPFSDSAPIRLRLEDGDALDVREVTPTAGTVLTGTAPLRFTVTLDYALSSLPRALLEVRVAAIESNSGRGSGSYDGGDLTVSPVETENDSGRGVGLATIDPVSAGVDRSKVEILVSTSELLGPTELGLWLQLKADARSSPILIEMPQAYRWRYEP
jgi:hypothetical protein